MLKAVDLVVKLQGMDMRAAAIRAEIAQLPKQVAEIEKKLQGHLKRLEADKAQLAAVQKERRALDGEVQMQQQKISKLRDQMTSAKNNEQYRAFQHEIEFCETAIRKAEDRALEIMTESEKLDQNVKVAEAALKQEREEVEKEKAAARERTAADQKLLDELLAERKLAVSEIEPKAYALYEKLAKKFNTTAVSEVVNRRCTACQLELRPQLYQDLRKGDKFYVCENCGRLLHYNAPVIFDTPSSSSEPTPARSGTRVDMS